MVWNWAHKGGDVRLSDLGVPKNGLELVEQGRGTEVESFGTPRRGQRYREGFGSDRERVGTGRE
jgi:hypothetical protein